MQTRSYQSNDPKQTERYSVAGQTMASKVSADLEGGVYHAKTKKVVTEKRKRRVEQQTRQYNIGRPTVQQRYQRTKISMGDSVARDITTQ